MTPPERPPGYSVTYDIADPVKRFAGRLARETAENLLRHGIREVEESRGESVYVWTTESGYIGSLSEGLGSKSLIADEVRKLTGLTYYDNLAQDTVGAIVNDLITLGLRPEVVFAKWEMDDYAWFNDGKRTRDLLRGWKSACDVAGVSWGGGETQMLEGLVAPGRIILGGSGVGTIPKNRGLIRGDRLGPGDRIVFLESSGLQSNGASFVRDNVHLLSNGYATKLSDGQLFGEAILRPSFIYSKVTEALFEAGVDIHYMVNITGHGWRKLMRAERELSYQIDFVPQVQEEFTILQKAVGQTDKFMYGTFNMGAGFAIMVPEQDAERSVEISKKQGVFATYGGRVEKAGRRVVIGPRGIVYEASTLGVR